MIRVGRDLKDRLDSIPFYGQWHLPLDQEWEIQSLSALEFFVGWLLNRGRNCLEKIVQN